MGFDPDFSGRISVFIRAVLPGRFLINKRLPARPCILLLATFLSAGMAPLQAGDPPVSVTVSCSANGDIISWPAPSDGWQLQENADLNTTNWMDLLTGVQEVGARKQVIVSPPAGNQFFRLQRQ